MVNTDTLAISAVEQRAVDIVLGLSGADYQQGPAAPAWTQTRSLSIQNEAASVVHLRFHAAVESSTSNGGHRGSPYGTEQVESELVVAFAYHLVPAHHARDLRLANDAAQLVARTINRDERGDWSPQFQSVQTGVDIDRGLALKSVTFTVIHNIEV